MNIDSENYAIAVEKLVRLASGDTGGSRAAAQVVLSAYNGNEWQLDITELCTLDDDYYAVAITVIRGRAELRIEPHLVIEDGDARFRRLWEQWSRYHINNRWKKECPECSGSGRTYVDEVSDDQIMCPRCAGKGLLET